MEFVVSRDPVKNQTIEEFPFTSLDAIPQVYDRSRMAQEAWRETSLKHRADKLKNLREAILDQTPSLVDLISRETGKPHFESLSQDIFPTVSSLTYLIHSGPKTLRDRSIHLKNPLFWHRRSYFQFIPHGCVLIISPWNFPLFLALGEIAPALLAGNSVIFKPSEHTSMVGLKIQALIEEAGFPLGLVQTTLGDGNVGSALIHQGPDKIFFTGSVKTGRIISTLAGEKMIPATLELGGKDPMIILSDADLDYASSAALWGAFANSGQMCASVERILVHESIAADFTDLLKRKVASLRVNPDQLNDTDLGAIAVDSQKDVYTEQLKEAQRSSKPRRPIRIWRHSNSKRQSVCAHYSHPGTMFGL